MATSFLSGQYQSDNRHAVLNTFASALWHVPGRFGIARILGRSYSLRCVVFHDVAGTESSFTRGMGVNTTPSQFEVTLQFLVRHYNPVSLQDVLDDRHGRSMPPRPVLVTFDDGYASIMETAVPLCRTLGVPAVFFLNASVLGNQRLSADNLVCYAANTFGMEVVNAAARAVKGGRAPRLGSLMEVFRRFFPFISLADRALFLRALIDQQGINESQLAREASLYLTSKQVRELSSPNFEVGNHTRSHVHGRSLSPRDFREEIDRNKAELEALSGKRVRSFSVPYGSSADLSGDLARHLRHSGHELIFLSEAVANSRGGERMCFDRIGPRAHSDDTLFLELELLPRLRTIRNWMNSPNTFSPQRLQRRVFQ